MTAPRPDRGTGGGGPLLTVTQVLDAYFIENRAKILDLAAFLDRIEAAKADPAGAADHRLKAVREALAILSGPQGDRARRILEQWSDPTTDPIPAATTKGATGAWPGPARR